MRPHYQRGIPALARHPEQIVPISAGTTVSSRREFPGARLACRGTPETPADRLGVRFGEPKYSERNSLGVRFGRTEVQCVDSLGCSVRANRSAVYGKTVIPRTNSLNVILLDYLCILA